MAVSSVANKEAFMDKGYAWVILVSSFLLNVIIEGAFSGMSVLVVELKHNFDARESEVIWIGGILISIGFIFSFLIGWLVKRFGCRKVGIVASLVVCASLIASAFAKTIVHLYITYGIMLGLSITCFFNISSIAVQQYFERYRAFAQGVLMAGLSVGTFSWPPFMRYLMDVFGWRGALILTAGIELHGVALSALLRPPPFSHKTLGMAQPEELLAVGEEEGTTAAADGGETAEARLQEGSLREESAEADKKGKGNCFNALFKILVIFPHFCLYVLAVVFTQAGNVLPYTLVPALADSHGIDRYRQALLVSIGAATSGVSRILSGLLGDRPQVNRILMCALSGIVAGALTTVTAFMSTFVALALTFAIIGLPSGSLMSGYASAAVDIVSKKYVQQGVGLMSVAFGFAHFSAFLVTGKLTDFEGGISTGFFVFGVIEAVGGVLFLICFLIDRRKKRRLAESSAAADAVET